MKKFWNHKEFPLVIATIVLGCISHFVYDWTGQNALAALFCPINESVWEHLKLLFFPYLIVITYSYRQQNPKKVSPTRYYCSRLFSVLIGMLTILTLFYTYTGILGQDFVAVDILIFICSVFVSFLCAPVFYYKCGICLHATSLIFIGWLALTLCFFLFTCYAPDLPLFYSSM